MKCLMPINGNTVHSYIRRPQWALMKQNISASSLIVVLVKWGLESFPGRDLSFRTAVQIKYSRIKDVPGLDVVKNNKNNFIN